MSCLETLSHKVCSLQSLKCGQHDCHGWTVSLDACACSSHCTQRMALFRCYLASKACFSPFIKALSLPCRYIGSALVTAAPNLIEEDKSMGSICASSRSLQAVAEPQQQQQQRVVVSFPSSQAIQSACKVPAVGSSWWQPPEALGATIHSQCSSPCHLLGQAQHLRSCHDRHSADVPS